jgi:hypothetical protein
MPIKDETLQDQLYNFLKTQGFRPTRLNSSGKLVPLGSMADVIKFNFKMNDIDYGQVYAAVLDANVVLWVEDSVLDSPNHSENSDEMSFNEVSKYIKDWAHDYQLGFERDDIENLEDEMAKREETKKLKESYHPVGRRISLNDSVPNVKIKIQHSKNMEEGMQRFRNVEKIYLENVDGERFLLNTKKPGIARIYARHIAEGGKVNDDRWNHINSLVEEYTNMAGFVRATRNGQFNESTQVLVSEGVEHYLKIRESLQKLAGKRGYNTYFENWSPTLNEDMGIGQPDLAEMFMSSSIDPRIERAMPVLMRIHKVSGKLDEVTELEEWTESIISEKLKPHGKIEINDLAAQFAEEIPVGDDGLNAKNVLSKYNLENEDLFDELDELAETDVDADARDIILSWALRTEDHDLHELAKEIKGVMKGDVQVTSPAATVPPPAPAAPPPQPAPQQTPPVMEDDTNLDPELVGRAIEMAIEGYRDPEIAEALDLELEDVQQMLDAYLEEIEAGTDQTVDESLDKQQSKVNQLGATEKAKTISPVIGKEPKQHPFKGKLVGASESIDPMIARMKKLSGLDK